ADLGPGGQDAGGDLDVAGSTIPGIPVVWTGRNRRVAWGVTNARAVTTDLYREKLGRRDPSMYFDGSRWRELARRPETLRVKGADAEQLVVRSTPHGPLLGVLVEGDREPLALAWTGARPDVRSGVASMLEVARAGSEAALLAALARHEEPPLAVVYATARGRAGMQVAGWIPRRALASGLMPLPGRARWYQWDERIAFEDLPKHRVSDRGWAIAADNVFARSRSRVAVEWLWRSGTRARRIDTLLRTAAANGPLGVRQVMALQTDVGMERAKRLVASALVLIEAGKPLGAVAREVVDFLREWDGRALESSSGAAVYHLFLSSLTRRLLEPKLGAEMLDRYLALPQVDPDLVVFEIVRDAEAGGATDEWSDPAFVSEAVRAGLRETWFKLSYQLGSNRDKWRWGRLHRLGFRSFFPRENLAGGPYALAPFGYGGAADTVSVGEYDRVDPYAVRVASTFRFAVDTSTLDQALVSLAPGQSGHPGHPHFADGVDRWRDGRPHLLITAPLLIEESSQSLLRLEPRS
ncbi:MAG: penicillin acylase family protein, partial [Myxococcota bacterium]